MKNGISLSSPRTRTESIFATFRTTLSVCFGECKNESECWLKMAENGLTLSFVKKMSP
jgi:hypothetical protein